MIRTALAAAALCLSGLPTLAAEQGCERLAWNLDVERALLAEPGSAIAIQPPAAQRLALKPASEAALPKPPERAPRSAGTFAGHVSVPIPEGGVYRVTLSSEAWLDVIQADAYRPVDAFTGVRDCPGIRKSVRFRLEPGTAIVQVSGSQAETVTVAVTRNR